MSTRSSSWNYDPRHSQPPEPDTHVLPAIESPPADWVPPTWPPQQAVPPPYAAPAYSAPAYYPQFPPYVPPPQPPQPRRKHRVFWWFFLAVQLAFVAWIALAIAKTNASGGIPAYCAQQGGSQADRSLCADAADTGAGLGFAAVVITWVVLDMLLSMIYGVYRLATRPR